jgi:hypothetical protein
MEAFMRRSAVILFTLALGVGMTAGRAGFAKAKGKGGGGKGAAPSTSELAKLKAIKLGDPKAGVFTWGMSPTEVIERMKGAIETRYQERIEGSKADPGKQQRIRDERAKEIDAVKKSYTKFEGQKTGWDVSIIGTEFAQNNGEAVIQAKEEIWTRYFFFFEDRLAKMFLAFNKEVIGNKSFRDFGAEMAAKYGNPREVYRDEKLRGSVKRTLDHFEWAVSGGDSLKLVDRSEFYGVYCLLLADASAADRILAKRKVTGSSAVEKDSLVEAVVNSKDNGADSNDDIIDRVTGHEVKKPGSEGKHGDIVVPMPTAPTPADVNGGGAKADKGPGKAAGAKGKKEKIAKEPQEKKPSGSGLEL